MKIKKLRRHFRLLTLLTFTTLLILASTIFIINKRKTNFPNNTLSPTPQNITNSNQPATTSPKNYEFPPMFQGVEWKSPISQDITIYRSKPYGPDVISGYIIYSLPTSKNPEEFLNYYQKRLKEEGWKLTAAVNIGMFKDSPEGYRETYEGGNKYITIKYYNEKDNKYVFIVEHN